jgi:hypothetical protein
MGQMMQVTNLMNDTVKIKRPMECRRREDLGGRVKKDPQGNMLKIKTRAEDATDESEDLLLERTVILQKEANC